MKLSHFLSILASVCLPVVLHAETYYINDALNYEKLVRESIAENRDFTGDEFYLTADIDVVAERIPCFNGVFHGNGHKFACVKGFADTIGPEGCVRDISIAVSAPAGGKYEYGSIANICRGTIVGCTSEGLFDKYTTLSFYTAGGICGVLEKGGRILNCRNNGGVSLSVVDSECSYFPRAGGIAGWSKGTIMNCTNTGTISGNGWHYAMAGGITGHSQGSIICSVNEGNVATRLYGLEELFSTSVQQYCGGIAGKAQGMGQINSCTNFGAINNTCGYVAGIVAYAENIEILNCLNAGPITSEDTYFYSCAAGICGYIDGRESGDGSLFYNCINTERIKCYTGTKFIATAGGVCPAGSYIKAANCLNFGIIDVFGGSKFKVETIKFDRSTVVNEPTSVAEANEFVESNNSIESNPFLLKLKGDGTNVRFEADARYAFETSPGAVRLYVDGDLTNASSINLYDLDHNPIRTLFANGQGEVMVDRLQPDTRYVVEARKGTNLLSRMEVFTLPVTYNYVPGKLTHKSVSVGLNTDLRGLQDVVYAWRIGDGSTGEWTDVDCSEPSVAVTGLKELTDYHLCATISWDGGKINLPPYRFKTIELFPIMKMACLGVDYIDFECLNLDDLQEKGIDTYGVAIKHRMLGEQPVLYRAAEKFTAEALLTQENENKFDMTMFTLRDDGLHLDKFEPVVLPQNLLYPKPLAVSSQYVTLKGSMEQKVNIDYKSRYIHFDLEQMDKEYSHTFTHVPNKPILENNTYYAYLPHNGAGHYRARIRFTEGKNQTIASPWVEFDLSPEDVEAENHAPVFSSIKNTAIGLQRSIFGIGDGWTMRAYVREPEGDWTLVKETKNTQCVYNYSEFADRVFDIVHEACDAQGNTYRSDIVRQICADTFMFLGSDKANSALAAPAFGDCLGDIHTREFDSIDVYTLSGMHIARFEKCSIARCTLPSGIYILSLRCPDYQTTIKIMR